MIKRWSVQIPGELMLDFDPHILDGYTGEISVNTNYDFMRNLHRISGTHDSTDVGSQLAVGRLVEFVARRSHGR